MGLNSHTTRPPPLFSVVLVFWFSTLQQQQHTSVTICLGVLYVDWLRGGRRIMNSGVQRSCEVMPTQPGPRLTKQGSKDSDGSVSSEGSKWVSCEETTRTNPSVQPLNLTARFTLFLTYLPCESLLARFVKGPFINLYHQYGLYFSNNITSIMP